MKRHNILQAFLAELAVPFTSPFSRDVFGRQPYKYSLYGLIEVTDEGQCSEKCGNNCNNYAGCDRSVYSYYVTNA